jgi:hypothetical protein
MSTLMATITIIPAINLNRCATIIPSKFFDEEPV